MKILLIALLLGIPTLSRAADFSTRCSAPGVFVCEGWDDASDFIPADYPATGLYPASDGAYRGTMDTQIKASGAGSLKFTILGNTGANHSGEWRHRFEQYFGEHSEFYVQFRQRLSPEMLSINWYGDMGTAWKQAIIHKFNSSCDKVALVLVHRNFTDKDVPNMYTACGQANLSDPGPVIQQGDYYCPYPEYPSSTCYYYTANEWITWYIHVAVGDWGVANSVIEAWVAPEGQPLKKFINQQAFTLNSNDNPDGTATDFFSEITLHAYMTRKDSSVNHPTAYTWFDELIVSSQPILPPDAMPSGTQPPAAPTSLMVN